MVELLLTRYRVLVLAAIFLLFYTVLLGRLWNEQVRRGADYAEKISDQSIRRVRLPAIRGRIYSADGKLLAGNTPNFGAVFHLNEMRSPGRQSKTVSHICDEAQRLATALGRKLSFARIDVERHMNFLPAIPFPVLDSLTPKELAILAEMTPAISGLEVVAEPERSYPGRRLACHLIGFCGKDDPIKAEDRGEYSYYIPDLKGKSGLEKKLDQSIDIGAGYRGLRGEAGNSLLMVDAKGFVHDELGVSRPPQLGNDVQLTIDSRAQALAERLLSDNRGAFVLLNAADGAVLAMASSPGYDLMKFANGISGKDYKALAKDPEKPFLNRALQSFMPGSIVKPLVALAALRAGGGANTTFFCDGAAKIGKTRLRCWSWKYGGHGDQDMREAIKNSCNVYFVEQGRRLGLAKLTQIYRAAGFGRPTGIGLPESAGIFPHESAKKRWTEYDTCLISIGQGPFTITPLQAAVYVAALANGGTVWQPFLLKAVYNYNHKLIYSSHAVKAGSLPATPDQLRVVREGMWRVVNDPKGSGNHAKTDVIELCGKTGTAQVSTGGGGKTHQGWFIGFGEKNGKLYALAITIEDAIGGGGLDCAPIARRFFEAYFPPETPPAKGQAPAPRAAPDSPQDADTVAGAGDEDEDAPVSPVTVEEDAADTEAEADDDSPREAQ